MNAQYLTQGGIPRGWTVHNLQWLAQAHRNLAHVPKTAVRRRDPRADWHLRWAILIEDLLESARVHRH